MPRRPAGSDPLLAPALLDVVHVDGRPPSASSEAPPYTPAPRPPAVTAMARSMTRRRAHTSGHRAQPSRMDIIDQLDASALGGSSLFHHDSPYDAISAHRNRHAARAPVLAFDGEPVAQPMDRGARSGSTGSSSRSGKVSRTASGSRSGSGSGSGAGSQPSTRITRSRTMHPTSSSGPGSGYYVSASAPYASSPLVSPKGLGETGEHSGTQSVSSLTADIWGVSAEPWQEFASPAAARTQPLAPPRAANQAGTNSATSSTLDLETTLRGGGVSSSGKGMGTRTPPAPPSAAPLPVEAETAPPKRSRSVIRRFKKDTSESPPTRPAAQGGGGRARATRSGGEDAPHVMFHASSPPQRAPPSPPSPTNHGSPDREGGSSRLSRSASLFTKLKRRKPPISA